MCHSDEGDGVARCGGKTAAAISHRERELPARKRDKSKRQPVGIRQDKTREGKTRHDETRGLEGWFESAHIDTSGTRQDWGFYGGCRQEVHGGGLGWGSPGSDAPLASEGRNS